MQERGRRAEISSPEAAVIGPRHRAECNTLKSGTQGKNPSIRKNFLTTTVLHHNFISQKIKIG